MVCLEIPSSSLSKAGNWRGFSSSQGIVTPFARFLLLLSKTLLVHTRIAVRASRLVGLVVVLGRRLGGPVRGLLGCRVVATGLVARVLTFEAHGPLRGARRAAARDAGPVRRAGLALAAARGRGGAWARARTGLTPFLCRRRALRADL